MMGRWNVNMGPRNVNMGPWNVNKVQCNVIMRLECDYGTVECE